MLIKHSLIGVNVSGKLRVFLEYLLMVSCWLLILVSFELAFLIFCNLYIHTTHCYCHTDTEEIIGITYSAKN